MRKQMERLLNADFSTVRIHRSSSATALNRKLKSRAFVIGEQVYLHDPNFDLTSLDGQRLLAHELAHVVQKRLGLSEAGVSLTNEMCAELEASAAATAVMNERPHTCVVPSAPEVPSCWGEAGHYYTTFLALDAAGVELRHCEQIAFFSQMADEVEEMDARFQGFRYSRLNGVVSDLNLPSLEPPTWMERAFRDRSEVASEMDYCLNIQKGFHCLNGHDSRVETDTRAGLLETEIPTTDVITWGWGVHALGDSFAHRKLGNEGALYSAPAGHAIEQIDPRKVVVEGKKKKRHGTMPDEIEHRPHLYVQYGQTLYALARSAFKPTRKIKGPSQITEDLESIGRMPNETAQIQGIRSLCPNLPAYRPEDNARLYGFEDFCRTWNVPVSRDYMERMSRQWATMSARTRKSSFQKLLNSQREDDKLIEELSHPSDLPFTEEIRTRIIALYNKKDLTAERIALYFNYKYEDVQNVIARLGHH